jgi:hypothetical protein
VFSRCDFIVCLGKSKYFLGNVCKIWTEGKGRFFRTAETFGVGGEY